MWEDVDDSDEDRVIDSPQDEIDIESIIRDQLETDIKVLESDCSFSDISESSTGSDDLKYAKIPEFPVQFNFIETLDGIPTIILIIQLIKKYLQLNGNQSYFKYVLV